MPFTMSRALLQKPEIAPQSPQIFTSFCVMPMSNTACLKSTLVNPSRGAFVSLMSGSVMLSGNSWKSATGLMPLH